MGDEECYFCGENEVINKHHVIPQEVMKNKKTVPLCPNCHEKTHRIIDPVIALLYKSRPELMKELRKSKDTTKLWTKEEDESIRKYYCNMTRPELQRQFLSQRTIDAITSRASKLGVNVRVRRWSSEERRLLVLNYMLTDLELKTEFFPNKTLGAIKFERHSLGLKKPIDYYHAVTQKQS